jgi:hypothetical protein
MKYIIVIGCFIIVVLLGIQLARDEEKRDRNKERVAQQAEPFS